MPRRNATGVVCKFLNWGIDVVCMVLLSGQPLTVTCAGLSMSLVLVVVFLVCGGGGSGGCRRGGDGIGGESFKFGRWFDSPGS